MNLKYMFTFLLGLVIIAINCTTAFAQTVATEITDPLVVADTTVHVINLMPLLQLTLPLLAVVLLVLVTYGAGLAVRKFGLEKLITEDQIKAMLHKQMEVAVQYGIQKLEKADWTKVETKNAVLANAANFMVDHSDELLAKAKITPEKLEELLTAKFNTFDATTPSVGASTLPTAETKITPAL